MTTTSHNGVPMFVKTIIGIVVFGFVLVFGVAWALSDIRHDQELNDCERSVAIRIDNRAMWLWLSEKFPEGSTQVHLEAELDRLLPVLRCEGSDPVPVKPVEEES